jgi:hypothetical protein
MGRNLIRRAARVLEAQQPYNLPEGSAGLNEFDSPSLRLPSWLSVGPNRGFLHAGHTFGPSLGFPGPSRAPTWAGFERHGSPPHTDYRSSIGSNRT